MITEHNALITQRLAQIERRANRWRELLHETGADQLGEVRAQLLIWRSGCGVNSMIVDTSVHLNSTPLVLSEAIWRLNDDYAGIMALEGARVNVPAPVPPSLGRTIYPGIDTANLCIWDGFVNTKEDIWSGLMWVTVPGQSTGTAPYRYLADGHRLPLIKDSARLRAAIEEQRAVEAEASWER